MTATDIPTDVTPLGDPIPQDAAQVQRDLLDTLLLILDVEGVNAQLISRVWVEAKSGASSSVERRWHPPQLIIYADGGWRVATVSIGPRSGCYAVELAQIGPGNQPLADRIEVVPVNKPSRVARLIAQNKRYQRGHVSEAS
ncbi:hypothetical protein HII36_01495 [Nonomuraea sp. NN258]|uniref:hypothetical protein n=1 Tax=Nonomuraea antri TaxID=2730852 RepID=UPI0015692C02|nr:hypothetical protein [Nonomuraea antri]NRQ30520.1 hypothetical protein [Nonomuraea antri]